MARGQNEAMVVVPMAALTLGLMDGQLLGAALLGAIPIVLLAQIREARIVQGDLLLAIVLMIISTLFYETTLLLVLRLTGESVDWWTGFANVAVPAAIVNAFLVPPVYGLILLGSSGVRQARPI
jgi:hypothetical protein